MGGFMESFMKPIVASLPTPMGAMQMAQEMKRAGTNLREFNQGGKSLRELYQEIQEGGAEIAYNPETGRVNRDSMGVKIHIEAGGYELCETARLYERTNREVLHDVPLPGASETITFDDYVETPWGMQWSPLKTGIRCLRQEWGIVPGKDFDLKPFVGSPELHQGEHEHFKGTLWYDHLFYDMSRIPLHASRDMLERLLHEQHDVLEHQSKAYLNFDSRVRTAHLRLIMPRRRWENGRRLKDENVRLLLKWFPIFPGI